MTSVGCGGFSLKKQKKKRKPFKTFLYAICTLFLASFYVRLSFLLFAAQIQKRETRKNECFSFLLVFHWRRWKKCNSKRNSTTRMNMKPSAKELMSLLWKIIIKNRYGQQWMESGLGIACFINGYSTLIRNYIEFSGDKVAI